MMRKSPLPPQVLPTMYDLPSETVEQPGLPDEFHLIQPELLRPQYYLLNVVFKITIILSNG